jgi:hypothetical protein
MIRKFNYTGRKKIEKRMIQIRLIRDTTPYPYFDMKLSFSPDDFPEESEVFVEAYDKSSFMRFNCGLLKNLQLPEDRHLSGLHSTDSITFRVKIVDPSDQHGKILGIADRISSVGENQEETKHISLLPVTYADIGKEIWNLDFRDTGPVLVINSTIEAVPITELIRSNDLFFSLVYPQVLREILVRILIVEGLPDDEDPEAWQNRWLAFVEKLPEVQQITGSYEFESPASNQDFFLKWIDEDAIPAFCRKYSVKEKFEMDIGGH